MDEKDGPVRRRVGWHVGVLCVLLIALWGVLDLDSSFTTDEGTYALQARASRDNGGDVGYAFLEVDPRGEHQPYFGAVFDGRQVRTYVSHPAWPGLLAVAAGIFGEALGFRIFGVTSIVVVAIASWAIAARIGSSRAGPWAFWIAAASPVAANGWILWAHAPSAACGALLAWATLQARVDRRWLVAVAASAGAGVLLRSEGVLWALAVAGGAAMVGALERRWRDLLPAAVGVATAATTLVAERSWSASLTQGSSGDTLTARGTVGDLGRRLDAAVTSLLDGGIGPGPERWLGFLGVLCVALVVVGVVKGSVELTGLRLVAVLAISTCRVAVASDVPATGLFAAAPLLLLCAVPAGVSGRAPIRVGAGPDPAATDRAGRRALAAACGAFALLVLATQYDDGGSLQWGGRFFSPLLGVLAAFAGIGARRLLGSVGAAGAGRLSSERFVAGVLAASLVVQGGAAVLITERVRRSNGEAIEQVVALGPDVLVASTTQIPRLDWRGWPERCWLAAPIGELGRVLEVVAAAGVDRVAFAGFDATEVRSVAGAVTAETGRRYGVVDLEASGPRRVSPPYRCLGR
ncbi:MAG: hypothetical protein AB7L84_06775 [Acidimicrobiia bacterium]